MSLYMHWACFDCCKSFHKLPAETKHKCPDCQTPMSDMGVYFEPPRRAAKKLWAIMRLLANHGYRFQTEGGKVYIDSHLIRDKRPNIQDVRLRIESDSPDVFKATFGEKVQSRRKYKKVS
jgi:hypothetical protein